VKLSSFRLFSSVQGSRRYQARCNCCHTRHIPCICFITHTRLYSTSNRSVANLHPLPPVKQRSVTRTLSQPQTVWSTGGREWYVVNNSIRNIDVFSVTSATVTADCPQYLVTLNICCYC